MATPIRPWRLTAAAVAIGVVCAGLFLARQPDRASRPRVSDAVGARASGATPLTAPLPAVPPAAAAVAGTVQTRGGGPIAGARVTLARRLTAWSPAERTAAPAVLAVATTGRDGDFAFSGIASGGLTLFASAPRFKPAAVQLAELTGRARQVLVLEPGGVSVQGRVVDTGSGPIGSAEVLAVRHGDGTLASVVTNEDGTFALALDSGAFTLAARAPGYGRATRELMLAADLTGVVLALDHAAMTSFTVVSSLPDGRTPVPGASISVHAAGDQGAPLWRLTTDQQGRQGAPLPEGRYLIHASHAGSVARSEIVVRLGEPNEHTLELASGLRAAGSVRDAAGVPSAAATVEIVGPGGRHTARSDPSGRFAFTGLLAGHYRLAATSPEHGEAKDELALEEDRDDLELVFAEPTARIVGRVLDGLDRPVPGARVLARATSATSFARTSAQVTTGTDGGFAIEVAPRSYALEARRGAEVGRTEGFAVSAGDTREVMVHIAAARFIAGTVRFRDGTPVVGAPVSGAVEELGLNTRAASDQDGRYRLGPFPRGSRVLVMASAPDLPAGSGTISGLRSSRGNGGASPRLERVDSPNARVVTIEDADLTDVALVIARADRRVAGRVVDAGGFPVEHAIVAVTNPAAAYAVSDAELARRPRNTYSDGDGRFQLTAVEAGAHMLVASHPELGRGVVENVAADASGVTIRLVAWARLTGEVVDGDGDPVPDFTVIVTDSGPRGAGTAAVRLRVSDDDGHFDIDPCPAGDLVVAVRDLSTGFVSRRSVTVRAGDVGRVSLTLAPE